MSWPSLTLGVMEGIHGLVKSILQLAVLVGLAMIPAGLSAQGRGAQAEVMSEPVPPEAIGSAVKAVSELGSAVVQGRYHVALERMNPKWKERYAQRMGGMKVLEEKLQAVTAQMVKHGITMLSCKPQGQPQAYGVSPTPQKFRQNGEVFERLVSTQWLVLVPTVTKFRVLKNRADGEPVKWVEIESTGFQVAVSERERDDWTFIDGAGLTVNDLRSLFITLPQDMKLPPVGKRETH